MNRVETPKENVIRIRVEDKKSRSRNASILKRRKNSEA